MEHVCCLAKLYGSLYEKEPDKTIVATLPVTLTEEQEKTEFAKYYHMGAVEPGKEIMDQFEPGRELDPACAYMPEQYTEEFINKPETFSLTGYSFLENGVVFGAFKTEQPGVNDENTAYYNEHFASGTGDLYYKVWCPGEHARLYPDIGIEDMGWGLCKTRVTTFINKDNFGLTVDPEEKDPAFFDLSGVMIEAWSAALPDDTEPMYFLEANYCRQTETGREAIHRIWVGLEWKDGKTILHPESSNEKALMYLRNVVHHCGCEHGTAARNTVEFFKEKH